ADRAGAARAAHADDARAGSRAARDVHRGGLHRLHVREHDAAPRRGHRGRRGDAPIASLTVRTERLELRPIPNLAGVALRAGDRAGATAALGVALDPAWPAPDLLDVLPGTEPFGACAIVETATSTV